ncbi:hypothetical protein V1524DRAFT_454241 [Lipomyces starkeyi]
MQIFDQGPRGTLLALAERIQEDAKRSAQYFRTQHLKEADKLPQLKRFPLPMQNLIVEELDALRHMGDDDPDGIDEDNETLERLRSRYNELEEGIDPE